MMDDKILTHLNTQVSERLQQITESIVDGVAKDFAEYRYLCGTIRGLSLAQIEIQDLVRRIRENDDE